MTLGIAMVCTEGDTGKPAVLFASDTQMTRGQLSIPTSKLTAYLGEGDPNDQAYGIVIAESGDAYVSEEVIWELFDLLGDKIPVDTEMVDIDLLNLRTEIGDIAWRVYQKYCERSRSNPYFELLIGACDETPVILHVTAQGKTHFITDFGIIGSGQVSGGRLLLSEFFREDLTAWEAAQLCSLVIKRVGKIDTTVSQEIIFKICYEGIERDFAEESIESIDLSSIDHWDLITKTYWEIQRNPDFEKKLRRLLGF